MADELEKYKKFVREKLARLIPVFARASVGDFSENLEIPEEDDEFAELYVGIQILVEVARLRMRDLEAINKGQEKSLKEKEALLKEVHHRVKNNLQIISSLLNLQMQGVRQINVKQFILESQSRIKAIALIHETLYQSQDFSKIYFTQYAQQICNYLFRAHNINQQRIALDIDADNISIDLSTAVSLGLILNELATNSLKYAFPKNAKGEISVSFREQNTNTTVLNFSDNGIGLPKGLDWKNAETLGLQLINTLVQQLEGKLEMKSEKGTHYKITFPNFTIREK